MFRSEPTPVGFGSRIKELRLACCGQCARASWVFAPKMDQENSLRLIELYQTYRFLWDPKDKAHHNKMKREDAWKEMSVKIQQPVNILKSKMKTLMGSYRSERSRENKSRLTGSGIEDVYKSKWFAYKYFDFLSDKDNPRETVDTEAAESSEEQSEVQVSTEPTSPSITSAASTSVATEQQEPQNTTAPGTSRMQRTGTKRKAAEQDVDSKMMNEALKIIHSSVNSSNDAYFTYALNLANELRKYDPTTLAHVKRAFANILFDADMGVYSTHSSYSSYGTASRTPTPYKSPTESSTISHDYSRDAVHLTSNTFSTSSDTSEHNIPTTTIESILLHI